MINIVLLPIANKLIEEFTKTKIKTNQNTNIRNQGL